LDAPDANAQVAHCGTTLETAHAAVEIDFVPLVDPVLTGVGVPIHEEAADERDQQHERTYGGVIGFTLHPGALLAHGSAHGRAPCHARHGNRPESTDWGY